MDYKGEGYEKLTLFKGIPYDEVKSILEKGSLQKLKAGEVLLRPGQTNTRLFLLLEGGLGIHFTDLVSEAYVEIMPGACIGELSVFYDKKQPLMEKPTATASSWLSTITLPGN